MVQNHNSKSATANQSTWRVTVTLLKHFRAFLRSDCTHMVDPIGRESPAYFPQRLTKPEARRKLHWLIDMAINRKAGILDVACRKQDPDYQREMFHAQRMLNTPRLIIDWLPPDLEARFAHRLRENI